MQEYELVREIENNCSRNQMRDIFFEEVETDSPEDYVRNLIKGEEVEITTDWKEDGQCTVFVNSCGTIQKFLFTPI